MNGEREDQEPGEVAEAAARWFVRLQDEAAGPEDWLALETWLAQSAEHQEAYDRIERLWVEAEDAGPELAPSDSAAVITFPVRKTGGTTGLSRRTWAIGLGAIAASLAVAVIGVRQWPAAPTQTYTTPAGHTRELRLADGTQIWMNAQSRIDVRLERGARKVEMAEGEAVFDVAHDPSRPFLIATGDRQVRVVGTRFDLRQRAGDFDLVVARGLVEVRPLSNTAAQPVRVAAGQRLAAPKAGPALLTQEAPEAAFAWMQGQLVYTDAPLDRVAADLSRSLGSPVRVADAATGQIRFSGVLSIDDRAAVLRRLEAFAPVRVETTDSGAVLRRR